MGQHARPKPPVHLREAGDGVEGEQAVRRRRRGAAACRGYRRCQPQQQPQARLDRWQAAAAPAAMPLQRVHHTR